MDRFSVLGKNYEKQRGKTLVSLKMLVNIKEKGAGGQGRERIKEAGMVAVVQLSLHEDESLTQS